MKKKFAIGVTIFGLYFIIDSCFQLYIKLFSPNYYSWYSSIFGALPENLIFIRYILSTIFRIFELILGIGTLFRKELFRKLVLFMSWFTVIIVYWRHPFNALAKHVQIVVNNIYPVTSYQLNSPAYIKLISWVSLGLLYAIDIGFAVLAMYYFTRPRIKEEFKK